MPTPRTARSISSICGDYNQSYATHVDSYYKNDYTCRSRSINETHVRVVNMTISLGDGHDIIFLDTRLLVFPALTSTIRPKS